MENQYKRYQSERPPDPKQPDYTGRPPAKIDSTGFRKGVNYVQGLGPSDASIMFLTPALLEEEGATHAESVTGKKIRQEARFLKGQAGAIFKDLALSVGIDLNDCYFTAWCKWLLPRASRTKPTNEQLDWGRAATMEEIMRVKPKIIVCLGGKKIFDELIGMKISSKDARGGWFLHEATGARVYFMESITMPVFKPEYLEKFRVDLKAINRMDMVLQGVEVKTVACNYTVVRKLTDLIPLIVMWRKESYTIFSVDCEWHGKDHVDGKLRSIQFCWKPGEACYIRFMDDALNYTFDVDYATVGKVLGSWLNREECKYIGHHFPADAPWMYTWLNLEWYQKCVFDSEFAQQTADEYEDLGLERIAMKYTDLGRYDIPLTLWKKQSKGMTKGGYGFVPDDILIPYACKDVDTVMRAYPQIMKKLGAQGLLPYYLNIFLPFTSDMFVNFALLGLPMDIEQMDELRDLYSFAKDRLEISLRRDMAKEASALLLRKMYALVPPQSIEAAQTIRELHAELVKRVHSDEKEEAWMMLKQFVGIKHIATIQPFFEHYVAAPNFNLRRKPQMLRWLFEVKGYTPIKSTNKKEKGLPSVSWDRVLKLPKEAQKEYSPSTDIQTLDILHETHGDKTIGSLLKLNAVGNITKQFLKEPITDDEGNITEERGLHDSLCSDGRVHGQMSTTETGRPRSWNPNILNWPSWVNDKISEGIAEALRTAKEDGVLPDRFIKYLDSKPPSIRSCVKAPPGWCFVESDYQTAEIRGLAFISGDTNLIRIMTEPDTQYRQLKELDAKGEPMYARVSFDSELGIFPGMYDYLLHTNDDDFARDAAGCFISPKADLHWSLAEMVTHKPREVLDKDIERKGLGKVGNFSTAYGASTTTLERKIEQDTGVKPDEGTGQAILDAIRLRQPVAVALLEDMEQVPGRDGMWRAASGRIRHCPLGVSCGRESRNILASLGREMRNFPFQESVAATAARAAKWLLANFRENGLEARPLIILYDSIVTLCPLAEAKEVAALHQRFMCDENNWEYHGRTMNYPIDTDFHKRWTTKLNAEEKLELGALVA
jgi:uracil-DNA glycosylase family 4